jgi:hypothetical protein
MIKVPVKFLRVGDVEDPDIYLGAVVWDWLQTEHGAWCKKHATDLVYHQHVDQMTMGYKYKIVATFNNEDALIYNLKWSHIK